MQNSVGGIIGKINELLKKLNEVTETAKKSINEVVKTSQNAANQIATINAAAAGAGGGGSGGSRSGSGGNKGGTPSTNPGGGNGEGPIVTTYKYFLTSTVKYYDTKGEGYSKGDLYGGILYEDIFENGVFKKRRKEKDFGSINTSKPFTLAKNSTSKKSIFSGDTGGYTGE